MLLTVNALFMLVKRHCFTQLLCRLNDIGFARFRGSAVVRCRGLSATCECWSWSARLEVIGARSTRQNVPAPLKPLELQSLAKTAKCATPPVFGSRRKSEN